jgi:hypothetical protein
MAFKSKGNGIRSVLSFVGSACILNNSRVGSGWANDLSAPPGICHKIQHSYISIMSTDCIDVSCMVLRINSELFLVH